MQKPVLLYGLVGGVLVAALQLAEYRYLVLEHSVQLYAALVAALCAALGVWLGRRLARSRERVVVRDVVREVVREVVVREVVTAPAPPPAPAPGPAPVVDAARAAGVSPREREILALMADGLTNREIAERLFVSENTVKTHSGRLFEKLGARRRTQAVQLGKQLGLLP